VCSALVALGSAVTREAALVVALDYMGGGVVPDELVELEGSHRDLVRGAERVRDVAPGEELTVTVYVRRNPGAHPVADPTAEAQKRPQDRRYLTPSEVEESFGASQSDLQAVVDYAKSKGLHTSDASKVKRSVRVTGPAGALGTAFGVELGYFKHGNVSYRGRVGPVKVPASLSGIVEAVIGFDNRPIGRSYLRPAATEAHRSFDTSAGGLPPNTYLPPQVGQMYDFPAAYDGTGETVAVFVFNGDIGSGQSAPGGYHLTTLNHYFTNELGMNPPALTNVVVQGPGNKPGDGKNPNDATGEVYLDLCMVGSLAPGAKIAVYFTQFSEQGWVEAISQAATDTVNDPSVISISYGNPENDPSNSLWTQMAVNQVNQAFEAATAAGRTICCAAGDSGAADEPGTTTVNADFPASSPWVLGCGGTRLESSGGTITSEVVWDDLTDGNGATGGGVSAVFPQPSWQAGTQAVPLPGVTPPPAPPGGRGVPDVSSLADPETPYVIVGPGGKLGGVGGTSAAAPLWSALISRYNQALGTRVGYLNPLLYTRYSGALRDITSGNNGGYAAEPGWDACTGWGSPGGSSLLQAIQAPTPAS
jgi:kumamolisin